MWQCPKCGEKLQVNFEVCWKCGTAADGTEDPDFEKPDEPPEDYDAEDETAELVETPNLKQYRYLTPADFHQHPVWIGCHTADYDEPWYEETDEETFRPWLGALPVSPGDSMFLVRATIKFADGTTRIGFVTPSESANDFGTMQPMIFSESGELFGIWVGMAELSAEERRRFYDAFGSQPNGIFPLTFSAEAGLTTGYASGTARGFYRLKDLQHLEEIDVFT
jgi:hypothetical protein